MSKMPDHVPYDIMHDVLDCLPLENVEPLKLVSGKMCTQARVYLSSTKKNSSPIKIMRFYLSNGNRKAAFQCFKDHMNAPPEKTQEKLELIVSMTAQPHMINQLKYRTWFQALKNFFIPDEKTKLFRQCGKFILDNLENEHLIFLEAPIFKTGNQSAYAKCMVENFFFKEKMSGFVKETDIYAFRDHLRFVDKMAFSVVATLWALNTIITRHSSPDLHDLYERINRQQAGGQYDRGDVFFGFLVKAHRDIATDDSTYDTTNEIIFFVRKLRENCEKQLYDQAVRWVYVVSADPAEFFEKFMLPTVAEKHQKPLQAAYLEYSELLKQQRQKNEVGATTSSA